MSTHASYIRFLSNIAVILTLATGCATTFRSEPEPVSLYSSKFDLDAHQHYTMGYTAGSKSNAVDTAFTIGTLTGMTLPFAAGGAAYAVSSVFDGNDSRDTVTTITGLGSLGLWIYGGGKLAKHVTKPKFDDTTESFSPTQRRAYEQGYENGIKFERTKHYSFGVLFGIGVDFGILLWMLSQIGPIGV